MTIKDDTSDVLPVIILLLSRTKSAITTFQPLKSTRTANVAVAASNERKSRRKPTQFSANQCSRKTGHAEPKDSLSLSSVLLDEPSYATNFSPLQDHYCGT